MASNIQLDDPTGHVIGLITRLYLWPGKFLAGRATWCPARNAKPHQPDPLRRPAHGAQPDTTLCPTHSSLALATIRTTREG